VEVSHVREDASEEYGKQEDMGTREAAGQLRPDASVWATACSMTEENTEDNRSKKAVSANGNRACSG
jgi:hypothetical protein